MYMHVYVCTCITYVYEYVCMYVCMYVRPYVCMYVCMYACVCVASARMTEDILSTADSCSIYDAPVGRD